jgi:hypothetical protein
MHNKKNKVLNYNIGYKKLHKLILLVHNRNIYKPQNLIIGYGNKI